MLKKYGQHEVFLPASVASDQQFEFGLKVMLSAIDAVVKNQDDWRDEGLLEALHAAEAAHSAK